MRCLAPSHLVYVAFGSHLQAFLHPHAPCSLRPAVMPVAWGKILLTLDLWGLSGGQRHCVCRRRWCPAHSGCSESLRLMNTHKTGCRDELTCLWPLAGKQLGRDSDLAPAGVGLTFSYTWAFQKWWEIAKQMKTTPKLYPHLIFLGFSHL